MTRPREQHDREQRILFEIVVDAYDDMERAMGWYHYLSDVLDMPFKARCKTLRSISRLDVGDEVEVVAMAAEDDGMSEVFVLVEYGKKKRAVPLAQLDCQSQHAETSQAVEDWHYWVARGYAY